MDKLISGAATPPAPATIAQLDELAAELKDRTVGVVYGAVSSEDRYYIQHSPREQMSVTALLESLERIGVRPLAIDPTRPGLVDQLARCDAVFPNLHGEYGEDGRLQGLLDYLRLPYVGSGVAASAIGADKDLCKQFMAAAGIRTPRSVLAPAAADRAAAEVAAAGLTLPVMVKPAAGGSSVGMSLAGTAAELAPAVEAARAGGDTKVLLEEFVTGDPVSVPALELPGQVQLLRSVQVATAGAFYDAESKLDADGRGLADYVDDGLPPGTVAELEEWTRALWNRLGCRGFLRADYVVDSRERAWALEVNTVPGLSREGNFATGAQAFGLGYDHVVTALLHEALTRTPDDVPLPRVPRPEQEHHA